MKWISTVEDPRNKVLYILDKYNRFTALRL